MKHLASLLLAVALLIPGCATTSTDSDTVTIRKPHVEVEQNEGDFPEIIYDRGDAP